MTTVLLIRHGATDWNHDGRYQGHSDTPLNALGVAQAQALAESLIGTEVAAAYSSDLQRSRQTAQIVCQAIGAPEPTIDRRLREIDLGEWEGRLAADIQREFPELWSARRADPANAAAPGGETGRQVAARVRAFLEDIHRQHNRQRVMVFSHGYTLATALCLAQGQPLAKAPGLIPENAVPIEIEWPAGDPPASPGA